MHIVISCEDHTISIIEKQEVENCRILFEGTFKECQKYKDSFIEDFEYTGPIWENVKNK